MNEKDRARHWLNLLERSVSSQSRLAYAVMNHDVMLEEGKVTKPENMYIGPTASPNPEAKLTFRKRIGMLGT